MASRLILNKIHHTIREKKKFHKSYATSGFVNLDLLSLMMLICTYGCINDMENGKSDHLLYFGIASHVALSNDRHLFKIFSKLAIIIITGFIKKM